MRQTRAMVISTFVGISMVTVIDREGEIINFENKDSAMEICKTMCEYDIDPSNHFHLSSREYWQDLRKKVERL